MADELPPSGGGPPAEVTNGASKEKGGGGASERHRKLREKIINTNKLVQLYQDQQELLKQAQVELKQRSDEVARLKEQLVHAPANQTGTLDGDAQMRLKTKEEEVRLLQAALDAEKKERDETRRQYLQLLRTAEQGKAAEGKAVAMQRSMDELHAEMAKRDSKIRSQESLIRQLEAVQRQGVKTKTEEYEKQIKKLTGEVEKKEKEKEQLQSSLDKLKDRTNQRMSKKDEIIGQLKDTIAHLKKDGGHGGEEGEEDRANTLALKEEIETLRKRVRELEDKEVEGDRSEQGVIAIRGGGLLGGDVNEVATMSTKKVEARNEEVIMLKRKVEELEVVVKEMEEECVNREREARKRVVDADGKLKKVEEKEKDTKRREEEIGRREREISRKEKEQGEREGELREKDKRIIGLEAEVEKLKRMVNSERRDSNVGRGEREITEKDSRIRDLEEEVEELRRENDSLKEGQDEGHGGKETGEKERRIHELEKEVEKLKKRKGSKKGEEERARDEELREKERRIEDLEVEVERLRRERGVGVTQWRDVGREGGDAGRLREQLLEAMAQLKAAEAMIDLMTHSRSNAEKKAGELARELFLKGNSGGSLSALTVGPASFLNRSVAPGMAPDSPPDAYQQHSFHHPISPVPPLALAQAANKRRADGITLAVPQKRARVQDTHIHPEEPPFTRERPLPPSRRQDQTEVEYIKNVVAMLRLPRPPKLKDVAMCLSSQSNVSSIDSFATGVCRVWQACASEWGMGLSTLYAASRDVPLLPLEDHIIAIVLAVAGASPWDGNVIGQLLQRAASTIIAGIHQAISVPELTVLCRGYVAVCRYRSFLGAVRVLCVEVSERATPPTAIHLLAAVASVWPNALSRATCDKTGLLDTLERCTQHHHAQYLKRRPDQYAVQRMEYAYKLLSTNCGWQYPPKRVQLKKDINSALDRFFKTSDPIPPGREGAECEVSDQVFDRMVSVSLLVQALLQTEGWATVHTAVVEGRLLAWLRQYATTNPLPPDTAPATHVAVATLALIGRLGRIALMWDLGGEGEPTSYVREILFKFASVENESGDLFFPASVVRAAIKAVFDWSASRVHTGGVREWYEELGEAKKGNIGQPITDVLVCA